MNLQSGRARARKRAFARIQTHTAMTDESKQRHETKHRQTGPAHDETVAAGGFHMLCRLIPRWVSRSVSFAPPISPFPTRHTGHTPPKRYDTIRYRRVHKRRQLGQLSIVANRQPKSEANRLYPTSAPVTPDRERLERCASSSNRFSIRPKRQNPIFNDRRPHDELNEQQKRTAATTMDGRTAVALNRTVRSGRGNKRSRGAKR